MNQHGNEQEPFENLRGDVEEDAKIADGSPSADEGTVALQNVQGCMIC